MEINCTLSEERDASDAVQNDEGIVKAPIPEEFCAADGASQPSESVQVVFIRSLKDSLTAAVDNGRRNCVARILEKYPELIGHVPQLLSNACKTNDTDTVEFALEKGAANYADQRKPPLHAACEHNASAVVKLLLENGFDPNTTDNQKKTPLHIAINKGDVESVEHLLAHKADTSITDYKGESPIRSLFTHTDKKVRKRLAKLLIVPGIDVNQVQNGKTALEEALEKGHSEIVKALLRNGANVLLLPMSCFSNTCQLKFFHDEINYDKAVEHFNNKEKKPFDRNEELLEYVENVYKLIILGRIKSKNSQENRSSSHQYRPKYRSPDDFMIFGDQSRQREVNSILDRSLLGLFVEAWNLICVSEPYEDEKFFKILRTLSTLLQFCKLGKETIDALAHIHYIHVIFLDNENLFSKFLARRRSKWLESRSGWPNDFEKNKYQKCIELANDIKENLKIYITYCKDRGPSDSFRQNMSYVEAIDGEITALKEYC